MHQEYESYEEMMHDMRKYTAIGILMAAATFVICLGWILCWW